MRFFLITLLVLLILILVVFGIYILIGYFTFRFVLSRNGKFKKGIELRSRNALENQPEISEYFSDNFQKLEIESNDGLKLYGYYKDNGKNKLAILVHGYGGDHFDMYSYAKIFEQRDYDIFAPDLRAHGISEGGIISMGLYEHYDLIKWIEKMLSIKNNYKIVLFGVSMGASSVCMTLGEKLSNNVVCAIEDCGYDNANNQLKYIYSKTKLAKFFYKIFYDYTKKTKGIDLKAVDVPEKLKKAKVPVLFIHGEKDNFVPTEMVYKLYECLPENRRQLYIAKEATHTKSIDVNEKEYKIILNKFLDKYCM